MEELLRNTTELAIKYLIELRSKRVFPDNDSIEKLEQLDFPFPEFSRNPTDVIKILDEIGSAATVASNAGRYFGFVVGGSLPVSLAANWLTSVWDQNAGFYISSPVSAKLEEITLKWIYSIFGLSPDCAGAFVTGTTMANFTALAVARHFLLKKQGWDVESKGLFNAPNINIIVGEEAHPTIFKGLSLLGLGRDRVIRIPVDKQGRMCENKIPIIKDPTIICCQAGNVNSGSFDPINEICDIAHERNAWVHVDGAFGLWAKASSKYRYLAEGIEKADSWATDLHKWLNVPYDNGLAIVKNTKALKAAMSISATYLPDNETREPFYYTPEVSRRARGIDVWAALYFLGKKGLSDLIERSCFFAKQISDNLSKAGYKILNDVALNQVLVSFGEEEITRKVIKEIQEDGTCWCGGTIWQGNAAMRISISSWATTEEDIKKTTEAILRIASNCTKSMQNEKK